MEKRVLLAVVLMAAVILGTNLLFPPEPPPGETARPVAPAVPSATGGTAPPPAATLALPPPTDAPGTPVHVETPLTRFTFSTRGASVTGVELLEYASQTREGEPVQLAPRGVREFLSHRLVVGSDTVPLASLPFQLEEEPRDVIPDGDSARVSFRYAGTGGIGVRIVYTVPGDGYRMGVQGVVTGAPPGSVLLTEVGPGLGVHDAEPGRYVRDVAVVLKQGDALDTRDAVKIERPERFPGPLSWGGIKDKYFLAALLAPEGREFSALLVRPAPALRWVDPGQADTTEIPRPVVAAAQPLDAAGTFALSAYLGPQEHQRMVAVGNDLEQVTPYGYRWLRPVVHPIAAASLWVLEQMHTTFGFSYGWALIVFGMLVRLLMWPLNAKAMRAQMRNMAVQPLMQEIQSKHKGDPERLQAEMVKLYKEHGFNPLAGCLPMLLPMPIFITLFFVFQNAIAFRGTAWGWLPDLSQRDPLYILPVLFMVTVFASQYISNRVSGMEINAQMKIMMYMMPVVMGIFFFNFASGLNLYYVASNVAGMPQQFLIALERRKVTAEQKAKSLPPPRRSPRKPPAKRK